MLINFTIEELKMLSVALSNNNLEFVVDGLPLWEKREKYELLEEKINEEIEYYDITEQED